MAASVLQGCTILVHPPPTAESEVPIDFADPMLDDRRVMVAGTITEATAAATIRRLLFLDARDDRPIELYLMTPGGDLKAAFAIERAMRGMRSRINTCAIGDCNSSGVVLLAAGTGERRAYHDSALVIHGMQVKGKPPARYVELTQETYTGFWRRRARLPEAWLPLPPGKLFVLTAQEALEYGVIDRIIPPETEESAD